LQTLGENAQTTANTALSNVEDMGADDKLTPTEKLVLKREYENIEAEYEKYSTVFLNGFQGVEWDTSSAVTAQSRMEDSVSSFYDSAIQTDFAKYAARYDNLGVYLEPLLNDMATTSVTDGTDLRQVFYDYYSARGDFLNRMGNEARAGLDAAVEIGSDNEGNGRIIIREFIQDDTAKERYWKFGKTGVSYNVVSNDGKTFSMNGGKIIASDSVFFDPGGHTQVSVYPNEGVTVNIQEVDGIKIGFSPHRVKCMTSLNGVSLLRNDTTETETVTFSHPVVDANGLVTGFKVGALQIGASAFFEKTGSYVTINKTSFTLLNEYTNFPPGVTEVYVKSRISDDAFFVNAWHEKLTFFSGGTAIDKFEIWGKDTDNSIALEFRFKDSGGNLLGTISRSGEIESPDIKASIKSESYFLYDSVYIKAQINALIYYS